MTYAKNDQKRTASWVVARVRVDTVDTYELALLPKEVLVTRVYGMTVDPSVTSTTTGDVHIAGTKVQSVSFAADQSVNNVAKYYVNETKVDLVVASAPSNPEDIYVIIEYVELTRTDGNHTRVR